VEDQEHDIGEGHQPETPGSREESLDPTTHSSVSKIHAAGSYLENIRISVSHRPFTHYEQQSQVSNQSSSDKYRTVQVAADLWTKPISQIQPNKFPGDFQDTFNKVPAGFLHWSSLHIIYFEPPANSSTIQDLHFPVLSRAWKIQEINSRTFQDALNPGLAGLQCCYTFGWSMPTGRTSPNTFYSHDAVTQCIVQSLWQRYVCLSVTRRYCA